ILPCGMELGVAAVGRAAWWSERHRRGSRRLVRPGRAADLKVPEHAPGEIWGEERSRALLTAAGFPPVPATVAATLADAVAAAERHGFPVALKAVIPGVAHKSDIGGVELGIGDPEELRTAAKRITERVTAAGYRPDGFLVSPMRPAGVELIAGVVRNP